MALTEPSRIPPHFTTCMEASRWGQGMCFFKVIANAFAEGGPGFPFYSENHLNPQKQTA